MRVLSLAHWAVRNCLLWVLKRNFIRGRRIKRYLKFADKPKLQIGFGSNRLEGWLNVGISLEESWQGAYMDAGKRFPLPDESMNYVYSKHLFEHLTYQQAQNMLKESYRVLKPGVSGAGEASSQGVYGVFDEGKRYACIASICHQPVPYQLGTSDYLRQRDIDEDTGRSWIQEHHIV